MWRAYWLSTELARCFLSAALLSSLAAAGGSSGRWSLSVVEAGLAGFDGRSQGCLYSWASAITSEHKRQVFGWLGANECRNSHLMFAPESE